MRDTVAYWCLVCKQPTARKMPDACGWDGSCKNCGMIAQVDVGKVAITGEFDFLENAKTALSTAENGCASARMRMNSLKLSEAISILLEARDSLERACTEMADFVASMEKVNGDG